MSFSLLTKRRTEMKIKLNATTLTSNRISNL